MARQSFEYKDKYGHFPLWTESAFAGMPAYTIATDGAATDQFRLFWAYAMTLGLPEPVSFFFIACICFYILMVVSPGQPMDRYTRVTGLCLFVL